MLEMGYRFFDPSHILVYGIDRFYPLLVLTFNVLLSGCGRLVAFSAPNAT
jgi:hypothetical protein